jgi:alanine or glycine:cation symporter, AGCS family
MRLLITVLLFVVALLAVPAQAQEAPPPASIDERINQVVGPAANFLSAVIFYSVPVVAGTDNFATPDINEAVAKVPLIVVWLIIGGLFFTVYLRFISLRGFRHAVHLVRGRYSDPTHPGEVSHFQALATALSGTVGLGNIAGVAIAITMGGPGAVFWMIIAGFLGMSLKFAECTLGVKYREHHADGTVSGGAMYYLSRGLPEVHPGLAVPGRIMAVLFAICCIGGALGGGNMFQVNQAHQQVADLVGGPDGWLAANGWFFGLIMAVLTGAVVIGGMKSIARVTGKLVPFMCLLYLAAGLVILAVNWQGVPAAFVHIVSEAFNPDPAMVVGGLVGALIAGFRRAAFSNEAGLGSAAIAHSAVRTKEPVTEGLVSLLEPFIDTIIICTMTALVIVTTGVHTQTGIDGVTITSRAFETVLPWFPEVLAVVVCLFAYSTMISWSYYGSRAWGYLFGFGRRTLLAYYLLFCIFIVIGASMELAKVVDFADAMMFAMAIFNIAGLYLMAGVIRRDLEHYWQRHQAGHFKRIR